MTRRSHVVYTPEHLQEVVDFFLLQDEFVFDVETRNPPGMEERHHDAVKHPNALNPRINEVYWLSMATYGMAVVIPMGHQHGEILEMVPAPMKEGQKRTSKRVPRFGPPPAQMTPGEVFAILKPLFFHPEIVKWGHNAKFDILSVSKYYGEPIAPPYADTLVLAHLLDENRSLRLIDLVKSEFNHAYEKIGKILEGEPFGRAASYSYMDAKYTWLWMRANMAKLPQENFEEFFDFLCDVTKVLVDMESVGIAIHEEDINDLDVLLRSEMDRVETYLFQEAGQPFLLTSNADKGWFVYDVCGHEPYIFTPKKKERSTAGNAFVRFESDPRVAAMMEWDDLHKLHSTYVVNFLSYLHDGRLHADFKQAGTVTGRFSCGEPNLQNVPRPDTEIGKKIRSLFWSGDPDHCLVVGDYSQIELRVLAHYSREPVYMRAFENGEDIHQATATGLGIERTIGKNLNFAIPFGAGPTKIAAMAKIKESVARKHYQAHKETYPKIWNWIAQTKKSAKLTRPPHVQMLLGRKRRVPGVFYGDDDARARAERQAVNAKIQGSAADLIQMAMVRINDMLDDDMHLLLQVHDELVVSTPRDKVERCMAIMEEAMTGQEMQVLRVPITANIGFADTWADAK